MTVTDLLRSLWRHKFIVIIAVALCSAAAVGGTMLRSPEYQVRASLLLRFDNNYYPKNPIAEGWEGDPVRVELANAVSTELSLLGSRSVLRATLHAVGGKDAWKAAEPTNENRVWLASEIKPLLASLKENFPMLSALSAMNNRPVEEESEEQVLNQVQERISIKRAEGTSVATVEMQHSNRDFAVKFVNALLAQYLSFRTTLFPEVPIDKLALQAADANRRLLVAQTELAQTKRKLGVVDPDAELSALLSGKARIQAGDPERTPTRPEARQIEVQRNMQLKLVDRRLAQLTEADATILPLKLAVEQARGDADRANRAYQRARLTADADIDQFIRVVDPATSTDKPIGLSMAISAVLGGLAGLAFSIVFAALDALRKAGRRRRDQSYTAISEYGWFRPAVIVTLPQTLEPGLRSLQAETDKAAP
jgi:uncharacterized protein involved in exopolysaccharide biosynthesis